MEALNVRSHAIRLTWIVILLVSLTVAGLNVPAVKAAPSPAAGTPDAPLLPETVSAGGFHTCGIRSDGSLACWGSNASGQATPPTGTYTQVSAGGNHTCASDFGVSLYSSKFCKDNQEEIQSHEPSFNGHVAHGRRKNRFLSAKQLQQE
jgi:hypothetical protein